MTEEEKTSIWEEMIEIRKVAISVAMWSTHPAVYAKKESQPVGALSSL